MDLWEFRRGSEAARVQAFKTELSKAEKQVEQFLDRIAATDIPSVVSTYETRIRKLEEQKLLLAEKIAQIANRAAAPKFR